MQNFFLRIVFAISFCFFIKPGTSTAQGTTNEGTDFWVAYAGHVDNLQSRLTLYITSKVSASVSINVGGVMYPGPIVLVANQPRAIVIDPNIYTNVYVKTSNNVELHPKKGIHVTSDKPIVIYSHISHSARSAACLVYPTNALGNDYYAISYDQLADAGTEIRSSQFTVVGVEDNTELEVTPSQSSRWLPDRPAGVPFVIKLNKGDIYQFQSQTDITGSRIRAVNGCKPFAVFSGSSKTGYCESGNTTSPNNPNGQDNLYQQLLPVAAWGRNFITAPTYNATKGFYDIYRIQVANDNTTITVNGSTTTANGTTLSNPYPKGSVVTFISQTSNTISANNPINVTQFQPSQSCNPANSQGSVLSVPGDPEMIILNPIEQTLKDITVYSAISTLAAPTNITSHYINAIIKTADAPTFTVDGVSFQSNPANASFATNKFIKIDNLYSYITVDVTAASEAGNPTHRIKADGGFVAIAYGYGQVESYGYLAGSDLRNLNQYIQTENLANTPVTSGCTKEPLKLYVILPYKTTSLKWDLGNGGAIETDPSPDSHYTPVTVNGVPSYKYRYFNDQVNFNTAGTYLIKALVVNPAPVGCDANESIDLNLAVADPPAADFSAAGNVCAGEDITFTDLSNGNGLEISKWYWTFGDGTPVEVRKTGDPFTHTYAKSGDFTASLVVEGISGCQSLISAPKTVHIYQLPKPAFSYSLCDKIQFKDESTSAEGTIVGWKWDFGDPDSGIGNNTSSEQNPTHTFSKPGSFDVLLTVTTDKGCVNEYTDKVYTKPTVDAGEDVIILRNGEKPLNAIGTGYQLKYKWVPSLGLDNDTIPNPIASPLEDTKYTVTVTAKGGCTAKDEIFVKVIEPDIPNAFSPNGDGINDQWAIKYLETYPQAAVQIFNRFGQKVYSSDPPVVPWDGTYKGKEIPVGVYYYILEPHNARKRMSGSITIVR